MTATVEQIEKKIRSLSDDERTELFRWIQSECLSQAQKSVKNEKSQSVKQMKNA